MLWFVGIGLAGKDSISAYTSKVISKSDAVFVEQFTSPTDSEYLESIEKIAPGKVHTAKRWMVEDGSKILEAARKGTATLLSWGDVYTATTHIELRTRAASEGIKTRTIHGASALTAMIGECGLHQYKVGKSATIMRESNQYLTPYYTVYKNLMQGAHTILLLEYNQDEGYFLKPNDAIKIMQDAEDAQRRGVIRDDTFCIIASRVGSQTQKITAGMIKNLTDVDFGIAPHTLIIPGSLHFTESDALGVLCQCLDEPCDNSQNTPSIPHQMITKYTPMIDTAIADAEKLCKDDKHMQEVLDGARRYADDAKRFLEEGREDLAVLCIGYADGLSDAVRIARGLEPAGASDTTG